MPRLSPSPFFLLAFVATPAYAKGDLLSFEALIVVVGYCAVFIYLINLFIISPVKAWLKQRDEKREKHQADLEFFKKISSEFNSDFLQGRRWLANLIGDAFKAKDEAIEQRLRSKHPPAIKTADELKAAKNERREAVAKLKFLEYELAAIKEYFPFIAEYEELILAEQVEGLSLRGLQAIDDSDRAKLFLSQEEYEKLTLPVRYQRALDRYISRDKNPWEIGRTYERYLGYLYEVKGWDVTFYGAIYGFEDMGRDLICKKNKKTEIVQAKCWSREKTIHEKHIFQLYGTTLLYELKDAAADEKVVGVFVTTTKLSDVATEAARRLCIEVRAVPLDSTYPMIKCNVGTEGKIYHLPFDQQYDRVKLVNAGECYAATISEAEGKGFRRAKRYSDQNLNNSPSYFKNHS